jgi:hypothetical protein
MLNKEFHEFFHVWREKAASHGHDLRGEFDRFFTLFVIYNRLYAEATFELARRPGSGVRLGANKLFPDGKAARVYVGQYLGNEHLIDVVEGDAGCADAIQSIITFLDEGRFFIKLHRVNGTRQVAEDQELSRKFRSHSKNQRAEAVLDFVYSVRCNLFHGHKSFKAIQLQVIRPANALLLALIEMLFERLNGP